MKEEKVLNLLHICRKAGKLTLGYDACERSCFSGLSKLILVAADLAENQKERIITLAEAYNVKWAEIGTKQILGAAFKTRDLGIISVDDQNFAKGIKKWIS
ncbi:MAG: ribosomal L7Ae/L30e/S12e/Gadd45 family protein [Candidatus Cloacimonadales bacterium]|nr:ribosomal L7Ae/L30e/S12e/Gadd45 family protein [Candidatus Cloacimonadales bacterium]